MPTRKDYGPATRRSGRLASQTSSRAGSEVSQETNTVVARKGKTGFNSRPSGFNTRPRIANVNTSIAKRKTKEANADFDAEIACTYIVERGSRTYAYVDSLTNDEKGAVIKVFADREESLRQQIERLEQEKEEIAAKLKEAEDKKELRQLYLYERVHNAARAIDAARAAANPSSEDTAQVNGEEAEGPSTQVALAGEGTPGGADEESTLPEGLDESTPVPAPKPTSLLRRVANVFASPFRKAASPDVASTQTSDSPLGELPASRKRPAAEELPENTPRVIFPRSRPPETPGGPSSRNPTMPTSLDPISEHSEPNSLLTAAQPTPTPARRRTIANTRREPAASKTPVMLTQPRRPRETNADRRLEKLHQYQYWKDKVAELERDEDLKDVVSRRVKRVKVDDLTYIPHNRPGDAASTFRVPDIDSDDEMEVDDESELRTNIFARAASQTPVTEVKKVVPSNEIDTEATSKTVDTETTSKTVNTETTSKVNDTEAVLNDVGMDDDDDTDDGEEYDWPDIGTRQPNAITEEEEEQGHVDFQRGFKHYELTGEILVGLFE